MGKVAESLLPGMYETLSGAIGQKKPLSMLGDAALDIVDKINDGAPTGTIADMYSTIKKPTNPSWLQNLFKYLNTADDEGIPFGNLM